MNAGVFKVFSTFYTSCLYVYGGIYTCLTLFLGYYMCNDFIYVLCFYMNNGIGGLCTHALVSIYMTDGVFSLYTLPVMNQIECWCRIIL